METTYEVAGVDTLTLPHRTVPCHIGIKGNLPGAVIFLHGVNDPGACYETVEKGLCQGLNERLGRKDLAPGEYGKAYQALDAEVSQRVLSDKERLIYDNPDANLYARTEAKNTHSPFIPFYWGYRASDSEIAKDPKTGLPVTVRGQNQHIKGHRLDQDFAREGGMFPNATNNLPDMYGDGFKSTPLIDGLTKTAVSGKGAFINDAPPRKYFVLAAHRLAMLVRTMRNVQSRDPKIDPRHETITIMAHSQGTLIALLAQALLVQQGQRCADCLILVDSPYSVREVKPNDNKPLDDIQTPYARVQTLIDIVNEVTREPYAIPELAQMMIDADTYQGQTGSRWSATEGKRPPKEGDDLVRFVERDNRGKVYCYFCPEDSVVGMQGVEGIGTFGVPDNVEEHWDEPGIVGTMRVSVPHRRQIPAMEILAGLRFYQRMWTRLPRLGQDGTSWLLPVGTAPGHYAVREEGRSPWPEPTTNIFEAGLHKVKDSKHILGLTCHINGEALTPDHVPEMYGHEVVEGHVDEDGTDHAGKVAADRVTVDVALGNRHAKFLWIPMQTSGNPYVKPDTEAFKAGFNDRKHADDQTRSVRAVRLGKSTLDRWGLEREETPAEARARMPKDRDEFETNNYHSAILNHTENHRWVTAMDVAIGQAVTLDDPEWRKLLIAMAAWRYTEKEWKEIKNYGNHARLDDHAKALFSSTYTYFRKGIFPSEDIVPTEIPSLITKQTFADRRKLHAQGLMAVKTPEKSRAVEK